MADRLKPADSDRGSARRTPITSAGRFVPFHWQASSAQETRPFDPYHHWLGIPPADQPPNHYRLLGVNLYEGNPAVIDNAAERQLTYLRSLQTSPHAELARRLVGEIIAARICLLDDQNKATYDRWLENHLAGRLKVRVHDTSPSLPGAPPAAPTPTAAQQPSMVSAYESAETARDPTGDVHGESDARLPKWTGQSGSVTAEAELVAVKGDSVELRRKDSGETVSISIDQLGGSAYAITSRQLSTLEELGKKISTVFPRYEWDIWTAGASYVLVISRASDRLERRQ